MVSRLKVHNVFNLIIIMINIYNDIVLQSSMNDSKSILIGMVNFQKLSHHSYSILVLEPPPRILARPMVYQHYLLLVASVY